MSWKPSRSSGLMFEAFTRKALNAQNQVNEMLRTQKYIRYEYLNRFSKAYYLWWLNDNRASKAMYCKTTRPFNMYCETIFIEMFKRNIKLVYKPLQKILI